MRHFEIFDPFGEGRAVESLLRPWELGVEAAEPITAAGLAAYGAYEGVKAGWRKYKERQFWRGLKYGYGNPNVSKKLFDDTSIPVVPLPDPSDPSLPSSIHGMDPMPRDGGAWYTTRSRRVGRRKSVKSAKITRALTDMQTFTLGTAYNKYVGADGTTASWQYAKPGLYGEWDPGRPCLINLENVKESRTKTQGTTTYTGIITKLPMHLYDLSWAPVKTNRSGVGNEAVDHGGTNNLTGASFAAPENDSHSFIFDGETNTWRSTLRLATGQNAPYYMDLYGHNHTNDDSDLTPTSNYNALIVRNDKLRPLENVRWLERSNREGPPTFTETYGPRVYAKSLNIKYNIAGCRSSPTKVELRVIKILTPWMHPNYDKEMTTRSTEEQSFFQAEWSRMIRGMCINPIARGDIPEPMPQLKHRWFKTLAKKVVSFPEASADRSTIPMVSGSFHININQLQSHDWKVQGRGEPIATDDGEGVTDKALTYDAVPFLYSADQPTVTMSQKPWFSNRIMLLIRAVVPHQFRINRLTVGDEGTGTDDITTNVQQVDDLEDGGGNGGDPATGGDQEKMEDTANGIDGDLNDDGNYNQMDYNHYLTHFCPSYDLNITKSFVSFNEQITRR